MTTEHEAPGLPTAGERRRTTAERHAELERERREQRDREEIRAQRHDRLRDQDGLGLPKADRVALILGEGATECAERVIDTEALSIVRAWWVAATAIPYGPPMLVLCGGRGRGKTFAACWALVRSGGLYRKWSRYLRDYERFLLDRTADERGARALEAYWNAPLLVVDELGTERTPQTEIAREAFAELVDRRQTRGEQLTVLLTNMEIGELERRFRAGVYDNRTQSRMERFAKTYPVSGDDLRKRAPSTPGGAR